MTSRKLTLTPPSKPLTQAVLTALTARTGFPYRLNKASEIILDRTLAQLVLQLLSRETDPAVAKKPPPKVAGKPEAKTKAKASPNPTTFEEVSQAVVEVLKEAVIKLSAGVIHSRIAKAPSQGKKLFERHRQQLLDDGVIVKEGNGRGMKYGLPRAD